MFYVTAQREKLFQKKNNLTLGYKKTIQEDLSLNETAYITNLPILANEFTLDIHAVLRAGISIVTLLLCRDTITSASFFQFICQTIKNYNICLPKYTYYNNILSL